MDISKKLVRMKISDLIPYENNPRKIPEEAVADVCESYRQCGVIDPIEIDEDNVILAGHTRRLAALEMGIDKVDCLRVIGLTDEQKRKYRILANKTGERSAWDYDLLAAEIDELDFGDYDFDFEIPELNNSYSAEELEEADDYEPNVPVEPKAKRGQIFQLGNHRLMCGDSTSETDVKNLMGGEVADMVFTDPPYNIASDSKNFASDCSKKMNKLAESDWDKNFDISKTLDVITEVIAENATVYICTSHFLAGTIWQWMKRWADHYSYCVWSKPNPMPSLSKRHWTWNTELICYATKGKHVFHFPEEGHALSTWTIAKKNGETGHPTEKPVEVPEMAISHSSDIECIVLDLFGGSGSTLIACERLDRICYMMELDPHYVDIIIDRWEQFTGKQAVLLNG